MGHSTEKIDIAYSVYKNSISEVIANIEVYEHDLPKDVMSQVAEMFQSIASYEAAEDEKEPLWDGVFDTCTAVTSSLRKHAIFLFLKKIKEYKNIFKKYNYKGVMCEDERFVKIANNLMKRTFKDLRNELKQCYKDKLIINITSLEFNKKLEYIKGYLQVCIFPGGLKNGKEPYLPAEDLNEACLEQIYEEYKNLLKMHQEICPDVMKNGTKVSFNEKLFGAIASWIIPIALAANTIFGWLGHPLIPKLIDYCTQFLNIK